MKRIIVSILIFSLFLVLCACRNNDYIDNSESKENAMANSLTCKYDISAELTPSEKKLTYLQVATISNNGNMGVNELYFHLYGNHYQNENAHINVLSVTDSGKKELKYYMSDRDQLCRIVLDNPLDSKSNTSIYFRCEVILPDMTNRYGISIDGEIQISYFYPQLAVCDQHGWDLSSINDETDGRYADIADFTLNISVPEEYEIAVNGTECTSEIENGIKSYVFRADNRRDLVIIAYTHYRRVQRMVGDTIILGYFNADRVSQEEIDCVMDAATFGLQFYNKIFGQYPFDTLIITNSAIASKSQISMEYSGLVTIFISSDSEATVYHELAHQWFYALVGNDEGSEPWLDEGFAEYSSLLCMEVAGHDVETLWELRRMMADFSAGVSLDCKYDKTENDYYLFYGRAACFLRDLELSMGRDNFLQFLSDYCSEFSYDFSTTDSFLEFLKANSNVHFSALDSIIENYIY